MFGGFKFLNSKYFKTKQFTIIRLLFALLVVQTMAILQCGNYIQRHNNGKWCKSLIRRIVLSNKKIRPTKGVSTKLYFQAITTREGKRKVNAFINK